MEAEFSELFNATKREMAQSMCVRLHRRTSIEGDSVFSNTWGENIDLLLKKKGVEEKRGMCCKEWTTGDTWSAYNIAKCASSHKIHHARSGADKAAVRKKDPDAKQMEGVNQGKMGGETVIIYTD